MQVRSFSSIQMTKNTNNKPKTEKMSFGQNISRYNHQELLNLREDARNSVNTGAMMLAGGTLALGLGVGLPDVPQYVNPTPRQEVEYVATNTAKATGLLMGPLLGVAGGLTLTDGVAGNRAVNRAFEDRSRRLDETIALARR